METERNYYTKINVKSVTLKDCLLKNERARCSTTVDLRPFHGQGCDTVSIIFIRTHRKLAAQYVWAISLCRQMGQCQYQKDSSVGSLLDCRKKVKAGPGKKDIDHSWWKSDLEINDGIIEIFELLLLISICSGWPRCPAEMFYNVVWSLGIRKEKHTKIK